MKTSTKKTIMWLLVALTAICLAMGAVFGNAGYTASADGDENLTATKVSVSTDGEHMLLVTVIKDVTDVYEVGYDFTGEVTKEFGATDKYYTSITVAKNTANETTWTAQDIFGNEYENGKMIVWEIAYSPANAYNYTAYYIKGTRVGETLYANPEGKKSGTPRETAVPTYTVTLDKDNGEENTVLNDIAYGTTAAAIYAPAMIPEKEGYTFEGWYIGDVKVETTDAVTGNITVKAHYTVNTYTVTWKNGDTTLETDENVPYGTTPTYDGATPAKEATAQYTYTFDTWTPAVTAVTGDATYTATFTSTVNTYTVTWKDANGTTLETDENVPYGTTPEYNGETPSLANNGVIVYGAFASWDNEPATVTGDATYTATYEMAGISADFDTAEKELALSTTRKGGWADMGTLITTGEVVTLSAGIADENYGNGKAMKFTVTGGSGGSEADKIQFEFPAGLQVGKGTTMSFDFYMEAMDGNNGSGYGLGFTGGVWTDQYGAAVSQATYYPYHVFKDGALQHTWQNNRHATDVAGKWYHYDVTYLGSYVPQIAINTGGTERVIYIDNLSITDEESYTLTFDYNKAGKDNGSATVTNNVTIGELPALTEEDGFTAELGYEWAWAIDGKVIDATQVWAYGADKTATPLKIAKRVWAPAQVFTANADVADGNAEARFFFFGGGYADANNGAVTYNVSYDAELYSADEWQLTFYIYMDNTDPRNYLGQVVDYAATLIKINDANLSTAAGVWHKVTVPLGNVKVGMWTNGSYRNPVFYMTAITLEHK